VRAEILGVGTELLLGQIANERGLDQRATGRIGVDVLHHAAVGDTSSASRSDLSAPRADVLIATGGLGPTRTM
jgi:nicotinamide-nucleotide amidase